jgi:PhnB protein
MTIQAATPYFILNGKVERALPLYERALGATVETLQRFGDVDESCPEAMRDKVMHAELRIGSAILMMSDGPGEDPAGTTPGAGNVSVAVAFDDEQEMRRAFDHLTEGGRMIHAIFPAPWGALFGVVQDELGIHWMFNCDTTA